MQHSDKARSIRLALKTAFPYTLPIFAGFWFLGLTYGIYMNVSGFGFLPKCHREDVLDENGERIRLPSGRWKSRKVDTVDWNDQKYGEIWRHEWEVLQNQYLEKANRPEAD